MISITYRKFERTVDAAKGDIAANQGRIVALAEQIAEAELQKTGVLKTQAQAVSGELREVQAKRAEIEERQRKAVARVARNEVTAPQDGIVMDQKFFTVGGVVQPGGAILDLVPVEDKLVVEAKVQALDIDVVRPDLPAMVRLVAYKQRITPTLEGRVTRVSADSFTESKTGYVFFSATVEVSAEQLARVPNIKLYPGMPVEVAIVTGERTLLDYLMQPIMNSLARAFRDD